MSKIINTRIAQKHDVEAVWHSAECNIIPYKGELIIYDPDDTHANPRVKIGDGVSAPVDLPFAVDVSQADLDAKISNDEILQTTNASGTNKKVYISKLDDALYAADKRFVVTANIYNKTNNSLISAVPATNINKLFNGNFEDTLAISAGNYAVINISFENERDGFFLGYPYGDLIFSHYFNNISDEIRCRVYCNYASHGIGWHDLTVTELEGSSGRVFTANNTYYQISQIEITVTAKDDIPTDLSAIEFKLNRPFYKDSSVVGKHDSETLYYPLTAPSFIGDLTGTAAKATKDASGNVINTYYMKRGSYERIEGTATAHKNLNDYKQAGFYNVKTQYVDNCPDGIGIDAALLVYPWDTVGYELQEITETAASASLRRWIRKNNNSTWSEWEQVFSGNEVSGDFNVSGIFQNGKVYSNVASCYETSKVDEIVIKTKIPFTSSSMPLVHLKGWNYGAGSTIDLDIVWYVYQNAFYAYGTGVTSNGAWRPEVYLSTYTENNTKYVAISLKGEVYYPMFVAELQNLGNAPATYASGWTVQSKLVTNTTSIIPTTDQLQISYKKTSCDISGIADRAIQDRYGNYIDSHYATKEEELITVDDIDEICGTIIQVATLNEVTF